MAPFPSPGGLVPVPVGKACCAWDVTNMFGDCSFTCCPSPPSPPVAPPPPPLEENYYRQDTAVGPWGGSCTCADGQTCAPPSPPPPSSPSPASRPSLAPAPPARWQQRLLEARCHP